MIKVDLINYRIQSIEIGHTALKYAMKWDQAQPMEIYFGGVLCITGKSSGFTNSAIEAAIIHCRSLLEFLGLIAGSESKLNLRKNKLYPDDIVIEQFSNENGQLSKVTIQQAISCYPGKAEEAEHALAYVIYTANKGLAHNTKEFYLNNQASQLLEIAFRGVGSLMIRYFYTQMKIKPPASVVTFINKKRYA